MADFKRRTGFLRREEYQPAGNMVKSELFMFDNDLDDDVELSNHQINVKLRDFIEDYFIQFQQQQLTGGA